MLTVNILFSIVQMLFTVSTAINSCICQPEPGCSTLTLLLVNLSLKFQTFLSEIHH